MKGDILILNNDHLRAGQEIARLLLPRIIEKNNKFFLTVAGESGAGKSEVAEAVSRALQKYPINTYILAQDDYFILPPQSNAEKRYNDIGWVGINEVRIDLLNKTIKKIKDENYLIEKPLVIFRENRIDSETINFQPYKVIIIEGTYTTILNNIDCKVFIDRDFHDTKASRLKRNREKQDNFLEQILEIEHKIITAHKSQADLIISKDFEIKTKGES